MIAALSATARHQGEAPKPPNEWFMYVFKLSGRESWIRAAAACRPREERRAIFALSVLDERIDSFPCAYPGCVKPRRGPLCPGHLMQARRRGLRGLSPLALPSRSPAAIEERRRERDGAKKVPAALRTEEKCRRCGQVDWRVSEYVKSGRQSPTVVRKCQNCQRLRRKIGRLTLVMPTMGNMREVMA